MLSFLVSGALLTAFGIIFFAFVYQSGIDRMDREIRTLAESSLHGARPPEHWQSFDQSLRFIYGEDSTSRIALLIAGYGDRIEFQSENAPPELAELPRPELARPQGKGRPGAPPQRGSKPLNDRMGGPGSSAGFGGSEEHFSELDANNDGQISSEEFDGPAEHFSTLDANNDDILSQDEIREINEPRQGPNPARGTPPSTPPPSDSTTFKTIQTASGDWRIGMFHAPQLTLIMAMDMNTFYADINRFSTAFLIAVPLGLLLLGITGWFLAARAMRPVAIIADTAAGITAKGLDKRIPQVGNDIELERLVSVTNNMLDRLEKSYQHAVRFSADAAHELQTPLTILQGELDNAIQSSEDGSTEQQRYSMLLDELRNLKAVVQKLLLLAHADEGRLNLNPAPVKLSELIHDAAEDIEIMGPGLNIEMHIADDITISGDLALLNQTLRNMTSNAAKYATENGTVIFTLNQEPSGIQFTLANTAAPIPEEDRPLLFERFHRVEKSRTTAGSGLGLSLAREIARAHGGELALAPYADGMVTFTLTLPNT